MCSIRSTPQQSPPLRQAAAAAPDGFFSDALRNDTGEMMADVFDSVAAAAKPAAPASSGRSLRIARERVRAAMAARQAALGTRWPTPRAGRCQEVAAYLAA